MVPTQINQSINHIFKLRTKLEFVEKIWSRTRWKRCCLLLSSHVKNDGACEDCDESAYFGCYAARVLTRPVLEREGPSWHVGID